MDILVIDDDGLAGAMTAAVLEDLGHSTVQAEDAQQALALLAGAHAVGLIVCDLNMPGLSGIDLFRRLRATGSGLPFVLLSGDNPLGALAEEPGLDACLQKDEKLEHNLARTLARLAYN